MRDETLNDHETFVIERFPQYKHSGYTRQIVWLDKTMYQPVKVEFYDRKDTLLKTLTLKGYAQYLDTFWRVHTMEMINHQSKKSTTLVWENYQFKSGLTDRDFNKNALKRVR